jgi:hypothetical protein
MIVPVALMACDGGADTKLDASATDTGTTPTFTLSTDLLLTDREDYVFDATWQIPSTPIASASPAILLDWSTHTVDATGAERAADSYGILALYEIAATAGEVLERLAIDDLDAVITRTFTAPVEGEDSAELSDLGIDPRTMVEDATKTWLLALADEDGARTDVRDALVLIPSASTPGILVTIPDGLASYEYRVLLDGNDTLRTDADRGAYTLDWSALTVDAYGKPFAADRIDEVFVGRFDDVIEADDLGGEVLDLAAAASAWWTIDPAGATGVALGDCAGAGGAAFPGFTSGTAWLVGGRCTTCFGPAPMFVAVVDVRQP